MRRMQTNMADEVFPEVVISESEIAGAKLLKNPKDLTKAEAIRWLKCRGCRNLSELHLQQLQDK